MPRTLTRIDSRTPVLNTVVTLEGVCIAACIRYNLLRCCMPRTLTRIGSRTPALHGCNVGGCVPRRAQDADRAKLEAVFQGMDADDSGAPALAPQPVPRIVERSEGYGLAL